MSNTITGKAILRIDCHDNLWKDDPGGMLTIALNNFTITQDHGPPKVTPKKPAIWRTDSQGDQWIAVSIDTDRKTGWDAYQLWRHAQEYWLGEEFDLMFSANPDQSFLMDLKIREGETVWMETRYVLVGYENYDHYSGATEFDSDFDITRVRVINRRGPRRHHPYTSKAERAKRMEESKRILEDWLR